MSAIPSGIEVRTRSRALRDAIELLSSMRFSISLLTVICVASVIGTVVTQQQPFNTYVNQFGPFWADVFARFKLFSVYSAWWFLLILAFLVASTSLCIARNAPKILVDLRTYKEHMREKALASFHHKAQGATGEAPAEAFGRVSALLVADGWRAKVDPRSNGTMIAARRGAANKLGYIAAHSAIVLICVGGLLDGDLIVRLQMALQDKSVFSGGGMLRDVKPDHRLGPGTPTFRANILVSEGQRGSAAVINMQDGVVVQDLPFDIELKKFIVEYYPTGMPRLFASEVIIHDHETGEAKPALVKVNEPAFHRGVAIYQSSFDDGGSSVKLHAIPIGGGKAFDVEGVIGGSTQLASQTAAEKMTLEFSGLRVINVENFGKGATASGADVRKVDLMSTVQSHMGSGAKVKDKKELRNVGPSVSYKLRDAAGQAREFNNYMLPVELDGQRVFLAGARESPNDAFRYLRIPADDKDEITSWTRLRAGLADANLREQAVSRYIVKAAPEGKPETNEQLRQTASRVLALFAGADAAPADKPATKQTGGLQSLSDFLESTVPENDRQRISEVLLRILNGSLFELLNVTREAAGQGPMAPGEKTAAFMTLAVISLSDSFFYPSPLLFQLTDFKQVQASVFQVARAPGKTLVYLGAVMLIIGVFAMLYIRERRLWIWLAPTATGTALSAAMSTTRRTLAADAEFEQLTKSIMKGAT